MIISPKNINDLMMWSHETTHRLNRMIQVVNITVSAGSSSGSSPQNKLLVEGVIIGWNVINNPEGRIVKSITLNSNGSVTLLLTTNTSQDSHFSVSVLRRR